VISACFIGLLVLVIVLYATIVSRDMIITVSGLVGALEQ